MEIKEIIKDISEFDIKLEEHSNSLKSISDEIIGDITEQEDEFSFTINDDLSGLLHFRISAGCRVEKRELQ